MEISSLTFGCLFLLNIFPVALAFNRDKCFENTKERLGNQTLSPNSPYFFRDNPKGFPYSGLQNMTLTYEGCNALCGPQQTWYLDIGPRLTTWVIPIFLLIANMELSPLDKRNFLAILHLLGDPIDSLWSMLHKLDAWDQCVTLAECYKDFCPSCQKVIASIFAGHEEVHGSRILSEHYFHLLIEDLKLKTRMKEWRRAAVRMADSRTNELGRTVFALMVYCLQLTAAFVPAVGGDPPGPPGGRIAIGVLLSWLVPAILLSNAIGNLASRRTAHDIMADLSESVGDNLFRVESQHSVLLPGFPSVARVSSSEHLDAIAWSGAIYTYRPWKLRYVTPVRCRPFHTLLLVTLGAAPVIFGILGGSLILWYQVPLGWNCRHVWLLSVGFLWLVSVSITSMTYRSGLATGLYHWRVTLIKDACVAIPSLSAMILSSIGLYNSCWCWSGPFQYPGKQRVPLLRTPFFHNAETSLPTIVGLTLLIEMLLVLAMAFIWRRGLGLLRWDERTRQTEWKQVMNETTCECMREDGKIQPLGTTPETSLLDGNSRMDFLETRT